MYDELVKRLREPCQYENCILCQQAADAIEELSKQLDGMNEANIALYGALPKWIPSEDCLPQNGEEVITLGPNGGMECGFYRGFCGSRKGKWEWKKHTVRAVKYWMPRKELPEPPKEGK